MKVSRTCLSVVGLTAAIFMASACGGGGGGGGTSGENASEALVVMDINVADLDGVALNKDLEIIFSEDLDPDSVRPETIQIREGPDFGIQVPGDFRVDGNRVFFEPRLPTDDQYENGGFHAGFTYRITIPGVPTVAAVRNYTQDRVLASEYVATFQTALADDPDIFVDNFLDPGPPRVVSMNPGNNAIEVPPTAVITLTFNRRPLEPSTVSRENFSLMMLERAGVTWNRPIPGVPVLTQNLYRTMVTFQPDFDLADNALYELTVSNRVEDLIGSSVPTFTSRFSIKDVDWQAGKLRLSFTEQEKIDTMDADRTTASWNGLVPNHLAAIFVAARSTGQSGDMIANSDREYTPFNTIGVGSEVEDGVTYDIFNFKKFEIMPNVTVSFKGSADANPVKIRSIDPMKINGILTVSGGKGDQAASYNYNSSGHKLKPPKYGGAPGPGGTGGADGYIGTVYKTEFADADDCPFGGYGGKGGKTAPYISTSYFLSYSGGGGGGGSREAGKAGVQSNYSTTTYRGKGGPGGAAADGNNVARRPNVGGAGGGGGGTGIYVYVGGGYTRAWHTGAGGGGGGGGLWLECASTISVGTAGQVLAEGGDGGDTASTGSYSYWAGAAGGGGGGSIKAIANAGIQLASGAKLSVAGGAGGEFRLTYLTKGAQGGDGGDGFLRFDAPVPSMITGLSGADLTYTPSIGTFIPATGNSFPTVGQTTWLNLGVFDPELIAHDPTKDFSAVLEDGFIEIWVQMADEHPGKPGEPYLIDLDVANDSTYDEDTLSEWTQITNQNSLKGKGYQFIRVRVIFILNPVAIFSDPLPKLDWLDIHFRY